MAKIKFLKHEAEKAANKKQNKILIVALVVSVLLNLVLLFV
jgi:hypothetical protein